MRCDSVSLHLTRGLSRDTRALRKLGTIVIPNISLTHFDWDSLTLFRMKRKKVKLLVHLRYGGIVTLLGSVLGLESSWKTHIKAGNYFRVTANNVSFTASIRLQTFRRMYGKDWLLRKHCSTTFWTSCSRDKSVLPVLNVVELQLKLQRMSADPAEAECV